MPLLLIVMSTISVKAQHPCAQSKARAYEKKITHSKIKKTTSVNPPENDYDLKFYHLNLNAERTNLDISGNVRCMAEVTATAMDSFAFVLHANHTVDSVYINNTKQSYVRRDSLVMVGTSTTIPQGQMVDATVYYHGTCPNNASAAIGNGYNHANSPSWGNEVVWTLSESFAAYEWFPCKQDLTDKIDSSWVYVTTDSTNMVGSNGLLKNVVTIGSKKRYEWKSSYPIDYYLISISVAQYVPYNLYAKPLYLPNDSILVQNFVYNNAINNTNWINNQRGDLDKITTTIELFSKLYGMYPFYKEKYGHCMAPLSGGMEHQTMTTQGFFEFTIDAHELAHQWWGDHVTCRAWKDIWMNEGWASYNEYIASQYIISQATADNNMLQVHSNVMSQVGGSIYFTNSDTMNTVRIFDSRLTYDKGGAILHSLRFVMNNDSLFFPLMRDFQSAYSYSVASTEEFKHYLNAHSGMNFDQFFNQWYYGEGYPTFNVKWNQIGNNFYLRNTQTTSVPASVPLFITPIEYKISRSSMADTIVRFDHSQAVENFGFNLTGTVTAVAVDPHNWLINKAVGPTKDVTLVGINELAQHVEVFVGPNPTSDVLNVNTYQKNPVVIELLNLNGQLIKSVNCQGMTQFDMSALSNGMYLVNVKETSGNLIHSVKILKQ